MVRYYQRDFEELYYIIDSNVISEKEFDERVMYDGYSAFEDSLTGEEIVGLLNKNEQLKRLNGKQMEEIECLSEENKQLKDIVNRCFNIITESEWAKKEYCDALCRILGEENDVDKAKQRIKEFLE